MMSINGGECGINVDTYSLLNNIIYLGWGSLIFLNSIINLQTHCATPKFPIFPSVNTKKTTESKAIKRAIVKTLYVLTDNVLNAQLNIRAYLKLCAEDWMTRRHDSTPDQENQEASQSSLSRFWFLPCYTTKTFKSLSKEQCNSSLLRKWELAY